MLKIVPIELRFNKIHFFSVKSSLVMIWLDFWKFAVTVIFWTRFESLYLRNDYSDIKNIHIVGKVFDGTSKLSVSQILFRGHAIHKNYFTITYTSKDSIWVDLPKIYDEFLCLRKNWWCVHGWSIVFHLMVTFNVQFCAVIYTEISIHLNNNSVCVFLCGNTDAETDKMRWRRWPKQKKQ